MTDLKEQAKKIIAKGKILNDPELIKMGLDMLDAMPDQEDIIDKGENFIKVSSSSSFIDQFRTDNKSPIDTKYGRKVTVNVSGRVNGFKDDKTEATE
jgi:hypothetical protein